MTSTTNITPQACVDYYVNYRHPVKKGEEATREEHITRTICAYDFAVTLSNGSLLMAIGALALGILHVLSPVLALALVGTSALVYWQMNEKVIPYSEGFASTSRKVGAVTYCALELEGLGLPQMRAQKESEEDWNPVAYNFFNRIAFYRYAPKAPEPVKKKEKAAEGEGVRAEGAPRRRKESSATVAPLKES